MFEVILHVSAINVSIGIDDFCLPLHISIHPCAEDDLAIFQLDHSLALQLIMPALLLLDRQFLSDIILKATLGLLMVLGLMIFLSREKSFFVI
jgi:hypothetical protein